MFCKGQALMNVETGHLVGDLKGLEDPFGYEVVPKRLRKEAKKKLKGRREAVIDLKGKSGLALWAERVREKKKIYPNYLKNQQLRRRMRREGVTGFKIKNGTMVPGEEKE